MGFKNDEDEAEFSLVDTKPKVKPKFGRRPFRQRWVQGQNRGRGRGMQGGRGAWGRRFNDRGGRQNGQRNRWGAWQQQNVKELALAVQPEWKLLEETELGSLAKAAADVGEPQDVYVHFCACVLWMTY